MATLTADQAARLDFLRIEISAGNTTQSAIAQATGVHQSQVSRVLAGQVSLASKNVLKLCSYAESLTTRDQALPNTVDRISSTIKLITGKNSVEDAAFERLLVCLCDWRRSWRGTP